MFAPRAGSLVTLLFLSSVACTPTPGAAPAPTGSGGRSGDVGGSGGGSNGSGGSANPAPMADAGLGPETEGSGGSGGAPVLDASAAGGNDAGDTATGTEAGPTGPCKFTLCEGFENAEMGGPADPKIWTAKGKSAVGSTRVKNGSKALHIGPLTKDSIFIRETTTFPALGHAFYWRVWVWVEQQPLERPATLYHWTMVEASEAPDDTGRVVRLGGHIEGDGTDWLRFNYETHLASTPHETGLSDTRAKLPIKMWHCVEGYFDMDAQEARIWLNGMERTALHWKDNMPGTIFKFPAAIQSLSFGWTEYQAPSTPFEIWLDDLAVDAQKIGCD